MPCTATTSTNKCSWLSPTKLINSGKLKQWQHQKWIFVMLKNCDWATLNLHKCKVGGRGADEHEPGEQGGHYLLAARLVLVVVVVVVRTAAAATSLIVVHFVVKLNGGPDWFSTPSLIFSRRGSFFDHFFECVCAKNNNWISLIKSKSYSK